MDDSSEIAREEVRKRGLDVKFKMMTQVIIGGVLCILVGLACIGASASWERALRFRLPGVAVLFLGVVLVAWARSSLQKGLREAAQGMRDRRNR